MHMMTKWLIVSSLFVLLSGCYSNYSQSKKELLNLGRDYIHWEFYPSKTLQVDEDEKLKKDLNECVQSLKEKFGRPENLSIGQDQVLKCMKGKDWNPLEAVQVS